jgi:DNA invertase Pin-like site-specific DNA recombinase
MHNPNGKRVYSISEKEAFNENPSKKIKTTEDSIVSLCRDISKSHITGASANTSAIVYCRVSTKTQVFGTSLESQKLFCQEYCSNNNLNIKSIISESNSAKSMNKQVELNNLLKLNENINLVVYEPSRLSRNLSDFVNFIDQCKERNITIHFVHEELVSSNSSDLKKILSEIVDGETESKNIGMRVKRSIKYRKLQGTYKSSIPKYGYKYIKNNLGTHKIINIEEQRISNLINKLYWGSDIKSINHLLVKITGETHELYFTIVPEESVNKIDYGNMRMVDIVNFLNSIPILRRNKEWTSNAISKIVNEADN